MPTLQKRDFYNLKMLVCLKVRKLVMKELHERQLIRILKSSLNISLNLISYNEYLKQFNK